MKYQLFVLAGCPACAALELCMRDAGLAYDRVVLASPRHAADVLLLLSESDPRCPALSRGEQSASGLAACMTLLGRNDPEQAPPGPQASTGAGKELVDGVLSGRMLMARNERAFSLALGALRAAIQAWGGAMPAAMHRTGLFVPYLDLSIADGLSGGRFRLAAALGAREGALAAMACRLPAGFEDAYLDRLRCARSWVYWEGGASMLGTRETRFQRARHWPAARSTAGAGGMLI